MTSQANAIRPQATPGIWSGTFALASRELVRFFRQRTRVIGAIGQPIIFWVLFGAGLRGSFQSPEWASNLEQPLTYQEYFFPGIAVLIVMFTAIFSTISIIEDRREGFLQGVLAAPVPRSVIVLGKVLGGTVLAVIQAGLFLMVGPLLSYVGLSPGLQIEVGLLQGIFAVIFLTLIAVELTSLGFLIAWPMNSTQGFHAIMSIFLMPMWLLSGAFFPGGGSGWLSWIIRLNPLTYGVAGLRRLLYSGDLPVTDSLPSLPVCVLVTAVFGLACFAISAALVSRPTSHNVT
ncbi:ABC transporter permease [Fuerstiella marisgermanici]|uniref:Transport permease protein n=1 Tax=Fuerstiella marisgermanici TaxID=1891926 RepID=A0A1P8WD08_9PLAN|nr:ABC transporter permease [Fuerstiella marisgermanici]APZ91930.1 inner membrane transport permease [Fuerstiella marisgermanici]